MCLVKIKQSKLEKWLPLNLNVPNFKNTTLDLQEIPNVTDVGEMCWKTEKDKRNNGF